MPDQDVTVRKVAKQDELTEQPEHCAMDPQTVAALGVDVSQQVRITRTNGNRVLYTIRRTQDETPHDIVRMGLDGRQRLGKKAQSTPSGPSPAHGSCVRTCRTARPRTWASSSNGSTTPAGTT
jgi:hypothetical protein